MSTRPQVLALLLGIVLAGVVGVVWFRNRTPDPEVERFRVLARQRTSAEAAEEHLRVAKLENELLLVLAKRFERHEAQGGGEASIRTMLEVILLEPFDEEETAEVLSISRRLSTYIRLPLEERRQLLMKAEEALETQLEKLGIPKGYESLLTPIPEGENGADTYLEAIRVANEIVDRHPELEFYPWDLELYPDVDAEEVAKKFLDAYEPVIELVRKASRFPRSRFDTPYDSGVLTLEPMTGLLWVVKVVIQAALAHATLGNGKAAHELCRLAFRAAEVGDESVLAMDFTMKAIQLSVAIHTLAEVCRRVPPSLEEEEAYRGLLSGIDGSALAIRAVRGEACMRVHMMKHGLFGVNSGIEFDQKDENGLPQFVQTVDRVFPDFEEPAIVAVLLENLADESFIGGHLKFITNLSKGCQKANEEAVKWDQWSRTESNGLRYSACMISAEVALARTALYCYRFRRETGAWPGALSELEDRFGFEIPKDPYTGLPIRYREGLLFCVGEDGEDDSEGGYDDPYDDDRHFWLDIRK